MLRWLQIFVTACLFVAVNTSAQTLHETVRITLRTNPDVLASQYGVEAADELRKQARSGYFPVVDIILAGGEQNSNNTTTRALGKDDLSLTRVERSLTLKHANLQQGKHYAAISGWLKKTSH